MAIRQLVLPFDKPAPLAPDATYRDRLRTLLSHDLDFHGQDSGYASHDFHAFPAKFPPQLPYKFITALTKPGELVLDPMSGSGTTTLEALLTGRRGIGFDIDPLALLISQVKTTPFNANHVSQIGNDVLKQATLAVQDRPQVLADNLSRRWDDSTRQFLDYWFAHETQIELLALITEIEQVPHREIRTLLKLVFSAIIITKSGGVSLALDLAHTRPHRAKVIINRSDEVIEGADLLNSPSRRVKYLTKSLRSPLHEFQKRFQSCLNDLLAADVVDIQPHFAFGDAQSLPLTDDTVDLIVTSPPYASNAIDYMRAHKFSLVWLGYPIDDLGQKRKEYIGGEAVTNVSFERLPPDTAQVIHTIAELDAKKGKVLHRYYSEMTRVLGEMFRVLKPGKVAILVVGNSTMRGQDTQTHTCLASIGRAIGFEIPRIGVRHLDRNRRMMPAGSQLDLNSQIQQRMHEEYVIGFYKPTIQPGLSHRASQSMSQRNRESLLWSSLCASVSQTEQPQPRRSKAIPCK